MANYTTFMPAASGNQSLIESVVSLAKQKGKGVMLLACHINDDWADQWAGIFSFELQVPFSGFIRSDEDLKTMCQKAQTGFALYAVHCRSDSLEERFEAMGGVSMNEIEACVIAVIEETENASNS